MVVVVYDAFFGHDTVKTLDDHPRTLVSQETCLGLCALVSECEIITMMMMMMMMSDDSDYLAGRKRGLQIKTTA